MTGHGADGTPEILFQTIGLSKRYGGVVALAEVSIVLPGPGVYGLLGGNGSGKTTVLDIACGLTTPDAGRVHYRGRDISAWSASRRGALRLGFARTFQEPRVLRDLTVEQNALAAYPFASGTSWVGALTAPWAWEGEFRNARDAARRHLDLFGLDQYRKRLGRELSFGQQKSLELVRVFLSPARVLWLDEPLAGMDAQLSDRVVGLILDHVSTRAACLCVVDHRSEVVRSFADQVYELQAGRLIGATSSES